MKKIIALALSALLILSLFTGCTTKTDTTTPANDKPAAQPEQSETDATASTDPYKVGFALQTLEVAVWQRMVNGMQAAADESGIAFKCLVANSDVATQISNIENMIAMDYDAIIVHVFDTQAFADVVQQALDKGIVVCAYDDAIVDPASGENLKYQFSFVCDKWFHLMD